MLASDWAGLLGANPGSAGLSAGDVIAAHANLKPVVGTRALVFSQCSDEVLKPLPSGLSGTTSGCPGFD
jgi:hypothetical protein